MGEPARTTRNPRHSCPISFLEPSPRARKACRQLRVETVADFLNTPKEAFLAIRNCGPRTYEDVLERVERYLATTAPQTPSARYLEQPLKDLIRSPRAERAFLKLGICTVGDFLDTPKRAILAVPGVGERTYWQVAERVRALTGRAVSSFDLLPQPLLDYRLEDLALGAGLRVRLSGLGAQSIGDLLELGFDVLMQEPGIGAAGLEEIRAGFEMLIMVGLDAAVATPSEPENTAAPDEHQPVNFEVFLTQLVSVLSERQAELLRRRVGIVGSTAWDDIATVMRTSHESLRVFHAELRRSLQAKAGGLMSRLRDEADRELRAFEGILHCDRLAPGTILHDAGHATGNRLLPLRLLDFCFDDLHRNGRLLSTLSRREFELLTEQVTQLLAKTSLPRRLQQIEEELSEARGEFPRGVLMHILDEKLHLAVRIDPRHGEVLDHRRDVIADRLFDLVSEKPDPWIAEDLLFHYRDRHQRGRLGTILDKLRTDSRFLEIGPRRWTLRERLGDELTLAQAEADRIAKQTVADNGRLSLFTYGRGQELPERSIYLLLDALRSNESLRHLGRGEFCSATATTSVLMLRIQRDFKKAMGAVVLSRFLQNQPDDERRLVQRLLEDNQRFLEPEPDRIDLLTNYPFNEERMSSFLKTIASYLQRTRGYARCSELVDTLNETELGGEWLTAHLLLDLLRRNSNFELLPGGIVAQGDQGLGLWIQQKAREVLRRSRETLTAAEIVAEQPELAPFEVSVAELLDRDPMVLCGDDLRYTVI